MRCLATHSNRHLKYHCEVGTSSSDGIMSMQDRTMTECVVVCSLSLASNWTRNIDPRFGAVIGTYRDVLLILTKPR